MNSLGGISRRVSELYKFYEDREAQRAVILYEVFESMAAAVQKAGGSFQLHLDYVRLGELIRSYFLDVIRYKEYHFNPDDRSPEFSRILSSLDLGELDGVDPLSREWTKLVHKTVNINKSKVAAFTVKWILAYKPISVISLQVEPTSAEQPMFFTCVNEYFALNAALFALEIDASKISERKIDELIYAFRFRKFDELSYFMILSEDYLLGASERL
jgi:hypothetical protein